jgi:hypothetical protein
MRPEKLYAALGSEFRSMEAVCAEFAANRYATISVSSLNAR